MILANVIAINCKFVNKEEQAIVDIANGAILKNHQESMIRHVDIG